MENDRSMNNIGIIVVLTLLCVVAIVDNSFQASESTKKELKHARNLTNLIESNSKFINNGKIYKCKGF